MNASDRDTLIKDNGGTRSGEDRRQSTLIDDADERRSGGERRSGADRRRGQNSRGEKAVERREIFR